ncbi:hypothetical protein D3C81_1689520 [compost metagenome]
MSSSIVSEKIKGQDYRLVKLDPIKGGRLATRVAQQLAGALADVNGIKALIQSHLDKASGKAPEAQEGEGVASKLEALMNAPELLSALAGGVSKIDGEALYDLGLECIRGQLFGDHKLHDDMALNNWFADRPDHLLLVLAWALRVNCQGFFGLGGKA